LLDDIGPVVRQYVGRRLRNPDDANDTYQDTLMALHRARHTYDPSRPFEPWLFAIARHVAVDHFRYRMVHTSHEILVEELPERVGDADPARPRLAEALDRLPQAQREA